MRSAVTGIRAADLAAELASARLLLESLGVHLDYDAPPGLSPEIERGLALVLREAVTNIARHARASARADHASPAAATACSCASTTTAAAASPSTATA